MDTIYGTNIHLQKKKIIKLLRFWSRIFFRTKTGEGEGWCRETYKRRKRKIEGLHSKKFVACWWVPCSVLSQQAHPVVIVHWLIIKPDALVGLPHCHSVHTTFSLLSVTHVQSAQLHYILRERERENSIRFWYTIFLLERKKQEKTLCISVPNSCTREKNTRENSLHFGTQFLYLREKCKRKISTFL